MTIWDEWADAQRRARADLRLPVALAGRRPTADTSTSSRTSSREIRRNPDSRRLIVSAWNVGDIPRMKLPPCHAFFQFYVADGRLSCQLYQRSADIFLGVPFNIASYALLTHMVAQQCDLGVGDFVWVGGDCHLYLNHLEQVETQLARDAARRCRASSLKRKPPTLFDYRYDDIEFVGYAATRRSRRRSPCRRCRETVGCGTPRAKKKPAGRKMIAGKGDSDGRSVDPPRGVPGRRESPPDGVNRLDDLLAALTRSASVFERRLVAVQRRRPARRRCASRDRPRRRQARTARTPVRRCPWLSSCYRLIANAFWRRTLSNALCQHAVFAGRYGRARGPYEGNSAMPQRDNRGVG